LAEYTKAEAMDWARENLHGQWTTLMTPFTPEDELDEEGLRHNIRHIRSLGTRGGGCSWAMGEFWSLTMEERLRLFSVTADEAGGEWPIAAHVSHTSYKDMLALADHAEGSGFDILIVAAPYMVTKTEAQVIDWVKKLADNTNLGIMYYNSPQFGLVMSVDGLESLCKIPNVVGVKEASFNPELSIEAHTRLGRDSIISTPDEWIMFKGREMGFEQQVMFANTSDWRFDTPEKNYYNQFIDKAMRGDLDDEFYATHVKPMKEVSDKWWKRTVEMASGSLPAPLCKYWGELMGMAGGHVRQPHINFTDEIKAQVKQDVEEALLNI
jgi:4-hydroxy-tetrahydrodipicolinate synthase